MAYQILLSKKVFNKNKAIHNRYRNQRETSEDVNTHQKKNKRRKINKPRLKNSNIRLNQFGLFSNHSCNHIFRFGTLSFLNILSPAKILRTEIFAVCFIGISHCCTVYIQQKNNDNSKNDSATTHSDG